MRSKNFELPEGYSALLVQKEEKESIHGEIRQIIYPVGKIAPFKVWDETFAPDNMHKVSKLFELIRM